MKRILSADEVREIRDLTTAAQDVVFDLTITMPRKRVGRVGLRQDARPIAAFLTRISDDALALCDTIDEVRVYSTSATAEIARLQSVIGERDATIAELIDESEELRSRADAVSMTCELCKRPALELDAVTRACVRCLAVAS